MRAISSQIFDHDLKRKRIFHVLISTVDQGVDGSQQLRPAIKAWTAHSSSGHRRRRHDAPSGGVMAATLVRQPGGYDEPSSMRSSSTGVARSDKLT
jgi:hypothetical protein